MHGKLAHSAGRSLETPGFDKVSQDDIHDLPAEGDSDAKIIHTPVHYFSGGSVDEEVAHPGDPSALTGRSVGVYSFVQRFARRVDVNACARVGVCGCVSPCMLFARASVCLGCPSRLEGFQGHTRKAMIFRAGLRSIQKRHARAIGAPY